MTNDGAACIEYHAPKEFGTCDGCDHPFKRASHQMANGDDLCGWCYGERKGYFADSGGDV